MSFTMAGNTVAVDLDPIGAHEHQVRRDLAACYRLIAMFGWDDMLATHVSACVSTDSFLINPYGLLFEEITASSLVKVNLAGDVLQDTPQVVNRAGFVIHSAVHAARHDVQCVIHLHTMDGVAVSAVEPGLLPLNQTAMLIGNGIARHEYEGVAVDTAERERLVADLGDRDLMLLRNHGTLAVGRSIPAAFLNMYLLERSCTMQVRTLAMSLPLVSAETEAVARTGSLWGDEMAHHAEDLAWPALLRKLDRINPGYAD